MTSLTAMPMVDSRIRRIGRLLGWISLFATLALLSPGVIATAHAEELPAGPSCPAAAEGNENTVTGLEQMVDRLRAEAAERGDTSGNVVTLNTRGFNYSNTPTPSSPPESR
jgi:hypothetical protein